MLISKPILLNQGNCFVQIALRAQIVIIHYNYGCQCLLEEKNRHVQNLYEYFWSQNRETESEVRLGQTVGRRESEQPANFPPPHPCLVVFEREFRKVFFGEIKKLSNMYYKTNTLFFIYEGTYLLPESYLTMKIWVVAASDKLSLKVVSSFNTHLIK